VGWNGGGVDGGQTVAMYRLLYVMTEQTIALSQIARELS